MSVGHQTHYDITWPIKTTSVGQKWSHIKERSNNSKIDHKTVKLKNTE
jgi:hypothetical protein